MRMMGRRMQRVVTHGPTADRRVIVRLGRRHQWRRNRDVSRIGRVHGSRSIHGKSMIPIACRPWSASVPPEPHHQQDQSHDTGRARQQDQQQGREHHRRTMLPLIHPPQAPRHPSRGGDVLVALERLLGCNEDVAAPFDARTVSRCTLRWGECPHEPRSAPSSPGSNRGRNRHRYRCPGLLRSRFRWAARRSLGPPSKPISSGGASPSSRAAAEFRVSRFKFQGHESLKLETEDFRLPPYTANCTTRSWICPVQRAT